MTGEGEEGGGLPYTEQGPNQSDIIDSESRERDIATTLSEMFEPMCDSPGSTREGPLLDATCG